jgi:hypothetical protein
MTAAQEPRAGEVLKPCPFCGGRPGYSVKGFVFCHDCGAEGPEAPVEGEAGMAEQDAIAAWNRRPSESSASVGGEDGYKAAFYELADLMGLGASPESPRVVWETVMEPRLRAAFRTQAPATAPSDVDGAAEQIDTLCRLMADGRTEMGAISDVFSSTMHRRDRFVRALRALLDALSRQHQEGEGRE